MENSTGMDPLPDEVQIENVLSTLGAVGRFSLWVGFFGMALPTVIFYKMFLAEETGKQRLFHVLTLTVTAMAAMAYLFMALGEGWFEVAGRPLFYMRYIDWIITTPILLLDLCLLAQAEIEKTALLFLMDILMIIGGFLGSLLTTWYKYLFWGVAMLMYVPIVMELLFSIRDCARKAGEAVLGVYSFLSYLTVVMWSLYPVVWMLAEGSYVVGPGMEALLYMILDIISKVGFGFFLLRSHHALSEALTQSSAYETPEKAEGNTGKLDLSSSAQTMPPARTPSELDMESRLEASFNGAEGASRKSVTGAGPQTGERSIRAGGKRNPKSAMKAPAVDQHRGCPHCGALVSWNEMTVAGPEQASPRGSDFAAHVAPSAMGQLSRLSYTDHMAMHNHV